jgi:hypothetical protein
VWYNSTSGTLKSLVQIKAWSSGGNLSTARYGGASSTSGTQTASFFAGGANVPGAPTAGLTEEYNGYSWSSGGTLPPASPSATRDGMGGAGTLTAGLAFSGAPPTAGLTDTDQYDGTSWTAANPFNTARYSVTGTGTQTAGLMMGGFSSPPSINYNNTEEYDGTSWTTSPGSLATATRGMGASGLQTAGLAYGGQTPTTVATSQEYDGTSWTIGNSLNTARNGITGFGIQTNSIAAFGGPGQKTDTEQYDGTTWTTITSATNARRQAGGSGSAVAGLGFGGYASASQLTATEEFFSSIDNYDPSSQDAWSSGGNYPSTLTSFAGTGPATAAITGGGSNPSEPNTPARVKNISATYDGSAWTAVNPLATAVQGANIFGTTSAAGLQGGTTTSPSPPGRTEIFQEWDGTSWSSGTSASNKRQNGGGLGISTAGAVYGGQGTSTVLSSTEEWNGSAWTGGGTMNTARSAVGSGGTLTTGLAFGGEDGTNFIANTESYDGSTWTNENSMGTGRRFPFGFGDTTRAWAAGGEEGSQPAPGSIPSQTEEYNGTSWGVSTATLGTARFLGASTGTTSSGLAIGGQPPLTSATEEFNLGSPASPTGAAASTLTTS